jgi:hypothetical protein
MKRLELIACEAVQSELIERLESSVKDIEYTLIPRIEGKGKRTRKEGTQTWPELNFMLVTYLDDSDIPPAEEAIADVARRFPKEGIFAMVANAWRIN